MLAFITNKIITLKNHQGFRRYAANTSWMMAEQLLRIIAGLCVGIWVARYLGPEQFGLFSYVLAFTAILGGIAKLGLDGILVRELVDQPSLRDNYLGTAFWLKVIGAILVILLMAMIVPFASKDATTKLFIFIISGGLIFQSFEVVEFYFQSRVLGKVVSICKVVQLILSSIIKVCLVLSQADLIWFVVVIVFDAMSLGVSYLIAYKARNRLVFIKCFDIAIAKKLIKSSWPLIFSSLVVMMYMRTDQVMIKQMLGNNEVGVYSAAVRLSEAFYFIPMLVTSSLFPAILNAKKKDEELYQKRMLRLYTLLVWSAVCIALPLTFFSDWLVVGLFGESYSMAGEVLAIHIWASVLVFLGVAFSNYLVAENLTKISFQRTVLGAAVNILLNFVLIPRFGINGAAVATLISQFVANYAYDVFDKRLRGQLLLKTKSIFLPLRAFK